jgi:hypothetical protein
MMKKRIFSLVLALATLVPATLKAQSVLYVSNLGEPSSELGAGVAQDSWITTEFITGSNSAGYTLDYVEVLVGASAGSVNPSGFSLFFIRTIVVSPEITLAH